VRASAISLVVDLTCEAARAIFHGLFAGKLRQSLLLSSTLSIAGLNLRFLI